MTREKREREEGQATKPQNHKKPNNRSVASKNANNINDKSESSPSSPVSNQASFFNLPVIKVTPAQETKTTLHEYGQAIAIEELIDYYNTVYKRELSDNSTEGAKRKALKEAGREMLQKYAKQGDSSQFYIFGKLPEGDKTLSRLHCVLNVTKEENKLPVLTLFDLGSVNLTNLEIKADLITKTIDTDKELQRTFTLTDELLQKIKREINNTGTNSPAQNCLDAAKVQSFTLKPGTTNEWVAVSGVIKGNINLVSLPLDVPVTFTIGLTRLSVEYHNPLVSCSSTQKPLTINILPKQVEVDRTLTPPIDAKKSVKTGEMKYYQAKTLLAPPSSKEQDKKFADLLAALNSGRENKDEENIPKGKGPR